MAEREDNHPETDYAAHGATYEAFVGGVKYTLLGVAIILIAMAALL